MLLLQLKYHNKRKCGIQCGTLLARNALLVQLPQVLVL